jgi:hypothetical protein
VLTDDEADEVRQNAAGENAWKAFAGLRASGLIDWVRGEDSHIVKRPGPSGRAFTVSAITTAGMLACEYLQGSVSRCAWVNVLWPDHFDPGIECTSVDNCSVAKGLPRIV